MYQLERRVKCVVISVSSDDTGRPRVITVCFGFGLGSQCKSARSGNELSNWRESQKNMAGTGLPMEPFIQLNSSKKCPRKYSKSKVMSLVDKRKVSELFWIDLLEAKCEEGV